MKPELLKFMYMTSVLSACLGETPNSNRTRVTGGAAIAIPKSILANEPLRVLLCEEADRLIAATASDVTLRESSKKEMQQGYWPVYTVVDFQVDAYIADTPPPQAGITLMFPGGQYGNVIGKVPGIPSVKEGERWALALQYNGMSWSAPNPLLLESMKIEDTFILPTQNEIEIAMQEYCGE